MGLVVLNTPKMTHEELSLVVLRQDYVEGKISLQAFEDHVEGVLTGETPVYLGFGTIKEWR